ncbi:hypothetical protein [Azospirillum sp. SYSU D00513]|uniref:hypothetical protein n=1 Tax=Azospirillum sp. SYSU D00513 TaxID=2812561 RepID=UPI001A965C22|nr:hypothetical protein [Azospirillum sp. SYSU D00513]
MLLVLAAAPGVPAIAGDGHDHGAAQRSITMAPRTEARLGNQEVIVTYAGSKLVLFLQRYVDGTPTSGAELSVTADFMPSDLTEIAPGIYGSGELMLAGGRNDLEIAYTIGEESGTATLPLLLPGGAGGTAPAAAAAAPSGALPGFLLVLIAAGLFLGVNALLIRRVRVA